MGQYRSGGNWANRYVAVNFLRVDIVKFTKSNFKLTILKSLNNCLVHAKRTSNSFLFSPLLFSTYNCYSVKAIYSLRHCRNGNANCGLGPKVLSTLSFIASCRMRPVDSLLQPLWAKIVGKNSRNFVPNGTRVWSCRPWLEFVFENKKSNGVIEDV
jgi:hypothetical protein